MGGIGLFVELRRIREDASSLDELHALLFGLVTGTVRKLARARAYDQVLAYYLGACAEDGSATADDGGRRGTLLYGFSDAAGLCSMSMYATQHWFRMLLASVIGTADGVEGAAPAFDRLPARNRTKVAALLEARSCGCAICQGLRQGKRPRVEVPKPLTMLRLSDNPLRTIGAELSAD